MTTQKSNGQKNINISAPAAHGSLDIPVEPGSSIRFGFDTSAATFGREGNNLVITLPDGGVVQLVGYFVASGDASAESGTASSLPDFVLADGTAVSGVDFLKTMAGDMDLSTAAGPGANTGVGSGGAGEYGDDAGSLIDGIDRLGDTQSIYWDRNTQAPDTAPRLAPLQSASQDVGGGPVPPVIPPVIPPVVPPVVPPIVAPDGPYVRAVLYNPGNGSDPVTVPVFFDDGSGPVAIDSYLIGFNGTPSYATYDVTYAVPDGWSDSWLEVLFDQTTGRLEFRLTAEGIAEMQRLGLDGKDLVNFITVSVWDKDSQKGYDYNVEVVATDDPNFNSAAHDTSVVGDKMENIGEFHQGKGETGPYSIAASDRDDEIIINDAFLGGSSLHASGSANAALTADDYNTINLNEGVLNTDSGKTTHITSADGVLSVQKGVAANGDDTHNIVAMGAGSVTIANAVSEGTGLSADQGENHVSGKNITVTGDTFAVTASNGGINEVHGTGSVTIASNTNKAASAMLAESGGKNHVSAADGSLSVLAQGYLSPYAVKAADGGENRLEATGSTTVTITGYKSGVIADDGKNAITAEQGKITVTGRSGAALQAENGGENHVAGKDITLTASGAAGAYAKNGGENVITGTGGAVSASGYSGIQADGGKNTLSVEDGSISLSGSSNGSAGGASAINGGSNVIQATGNTTVNASGYYHGLYAKDGSNTLTAEDGKVTISGNYGGGVYADAGGSNTVAGSDISISSYQNGITSINGGKNHVAGDGTVTVNGSTYFGVSAKGAGSEAHVSGKEVNIKATYAVGVDGGGLVDVHGETVNLTATTASTVNNWSNGTINVEADKELNIRLTNANQSSAGVMTLTGTTTLKSGGDVNITVDKGTYQTAGINTWSNGTTNVEAEKDINIKVHAEKQEGKLSDGAVGIQVGSTQGGTNNITSKHGDITLNIDSTESGATGISTSGSGNTGGLTNISATEGTLTVNVLGTGNAYTARGITTSGPAATNVDVKNLDMDVKLTDSASNYRNGLAAVGISSSYNGQGYGVTTVNVAEKAEISVSSGGNTSGIAALGGANAKTTLTAGSLELTVTSTGTVDGSRATGMESNYPDTGYGNAGGINTVNVAGDAAITVTGKELAAGMYTGLSSGSNTLSAGGTVDMTVTSHEGNAYGMYGTGSISADSVTMTITGDLSAIVMNGKATITANTVHMDAESANGTAYGMHSAAYGQTNTVQSEAGKALDLEINADYAMYATGGKNVITGHSVNGGEGDSIRLNGDIEGGYGQNTVTTGAGDDVIVINGAISGTGALYVDGGAGNDTLVLVASSLEEFLDRYGDWLNGLNGTMLKGIENIEFSGIDNLDGLSPALDGFLNYANDSCINVGVQHSPETDALSALLADDGGLSALAGFDLADLLDGASDPLSIEPLHSGTHHAPEFVTDSGAHVASHGDAYYDAFGNSAGDDLLIQQQILNNFNS